MIEYEQVVNHLKKNGYSEQKNIADYWFSNSEECKRIIDSKFPHRNHSPIFELQVRWRSPLGEACVEALKKYIEQLKPQSTIDFNDFTFDFDGQNYSIKKVVSSFHTSHIEGWQDLRGIPLNGINLTDCILTDIDFSNASFTGANFHQLELINCNFIDANFDHSKFVAIEHKQKTQLGGISLRGAFIDGVELSDEVVNSRMRFSEIGYFELIKYLLETWRWKKTSVKSHVKWTKFKSINVHGLNNPVLRHQAEYIAWFQCLFDNFDKYDQLTFWEKISFSSSIVFTKDWSSVNVLGFYCILINLIFTILYIAPFSYFKNLSGNCIKGWSDDWVEMFYFSVVTFTTLGYGDLIPCNDIGRIIVILEVLVGYIALGAFLIIWGKKVSQKY